MRRRWGRGRSRRERLAAVLVLGGLAGFVLLVYVAVVLGGGVLIGHTSSPHVGLSVLATAVVALGFEPVQSWLEDVVSQLVRAGRLSPYDVLSRFSAALTSTYANEELPVRMAKVLADGTGAAGAQVWLVVDDRLTLAASWPPGAGSAVGAPGAGSVPGRRELPVRQAGDLLGVLAIQERDDVPLSPVEERLFAGLADQAGLVLRGARLRAELGRRFQELSTRAEELRISRQRLVDAQDAERRRLERDIHDGAQQHLVALAVNLRLAHTLAGRSPERADRLIAAQGPAATATIDTLISLSRGIYPSLLVDEGLVAALRTAISTSPVPVELHEVGTGRYSAEIEAAAYFCVLEALQNAAKHSSARSIRVELRGDPDRLTAIVGDDGSGIDPRTTASGAGLANMRDRVEAVGGTLTIETAPGRGTIVEARLPCLHIPDRQKG
ncbi:ATP-binding protein [Kribbella sp. NPDC050469]|uniref:GAF domain-containing sensor histidine kinase n=1 Tax=Kribbella sp. NPDC050469 TaxID=3364116 RepID=UPI0037A4C9FA